MVCIYCESPSKVINSRLQKRLNQVWRRRQCLRCGNAFTTHEAVELGASLVIRHSSRQLVPFDKDILFISIYESCKHRPTAIQDAAALTQTIIAYIRKELVDGTVTREVIIKNALATLGHFDKTAATVYTAYHPPTTDVVKPV